MIHKSQEFHRRLDKGGLDIHLKGESPLLISLDYKKADQDIQACYS